MRHMFENVAFDFDFPPGTQAWHVHLPWCSFPGHRKQVMLVGVHQVKLTCIYDEGEGAYCQCPSSVDARHAFLVTTYQARYDLCFFPPELSQKLKQLGEEALGAKQFNARREVACDSAFVLYRLTDPDYISAQSEALLAQALFSRARMLEGKDFETPPSDDEVRIKKAKGDERLAQLEAQFKEEFKKNYKEQK